MSRAAATISRSKSPVPLDGTFRSLVLTIGAFKRVMEPYFATFGIGGSQWGVLRNLYRAHEEGLSSLRLTDLSDRLVIKPPSVTEVVNRLQRMGLVRRADVAGDQRAKHVCLTPAGRRLVRRVLARHPRQIEAVLGGLNAEQRRELGQLLEQLREHLESLIERENVHHNGNGNS